MNQHTIQLWNYIKYAPDNIQAKYTNDTKKYIKDKLNLNWFNNTNNQNTCFFNGLKFHENKVLVINIHIITPNQKLQYLDITQSFNKLLKTYNIFYLSAITPIILLKYYRESSLAEQCRKLCSTRRSDLKRYTRFNSFVVIMFCVKD